MKICVIGTGYVGLVTGVCLADLGNEVICVDNNPEKIKKLQQKINPIYEPGLEILLEKNIEAARLTFTMNTAEAVKNSEIIYIAVGTPPKENGEADVSAVIAVAKEIAQGILINGGKFTVIVNKSTVPVGMGHIVRDSIESCGVNPESFGVVSNPEFLREGSAVTDSQNPDRIVLGSESAKALDIMEDLYKPLFRIKCPIIRTNLETAEMIKYASNAFLATKITFINEMANICDRVGADVHMVAKGMGLDGRISRYFLHPGPGYGGSCFPKDTKALVSIAKRVGYDLALVKATIEINEKQKRVVINKLNELFAGEFSGKTVALLGLAFKPNTDDMRDAPSLTIIEELLKLEVNIQGYDPVAMENTRKIIGDDILYTSDAYSCVKNADAVVLVTEWNEFKSLDFERLKNNMRQFNIVDARNIYDPNKMQKLGFNYLGIGRQPMKIESKVLQEV